MTTPIKYLFAILWSIGTFFLVTYAEFGLEYHTVSSIAGVVAVVTLGAVVYVVGLMVGALPWALINSKK